MLFAEDKNKVCEIHYVSLSEMFVCDSIMYVKCQLCSAWCHSKWNRQFYTLMFKSYYQCFCLLAMYCLAKWLLLFTSRLKTKKLISASCFTKFDHILTLLWYMFDFQVKNIIRGSFTLFQSMYKPILEEYASEGLLKIPLESHLDEFEQVSSLTETLHNCTIPSWSFVQT